MKKRVLITGQSSYIAKSFEQYSRKSDAEERTQMVVTLLSVRDNIWKKESFSHQRLSRLAPLIPVFPDIRNGRSMLCIENLCELLRLLIENRAPDYSNITVKGPSLTSATSICAPKVPCSTTDSSFLQASIKNSYNSSARAGFPAFVKLGRLPLRQSA